MIFGGSVALLVAVLVLPFALARIPAGGSDWEHLSEVGESYGGASAFLSAIALCGVVASLMLQYKQQRANLLYSVSQRHFDLVTFTLENPRFAYVWGERDLVNYDLKAFCNIIATHWITLWRMGYLNEESLRVLAANLFKSSIAREFWMEIGPNWLKRPSRQDARFCEIVTGEFARAIAVGPPTVVPPDQVDSANSPAASDSRKAHAAIESTTRAIVAGLLAGSAAATIVVRLFRRST